MKIEGCKSWNTEKYVITIFSSGKLYIISDKNTNRILGYLCAPEYDLQNGDCHTSLYQLNDSVFLIWNDGDVYSVVIIKPNH